MIKNIIIYGIIAGVIVGGLMLLNLEVTNFDFDNPYAIGINAEKYGVKRPNIHNDPEVWKQYPYRERIHTRDIYNVIITMFYESQFKVEDIVNSIIDLGYEKEDAEEWSLRWKNTIYCGND